MSAAWRTAVQRVGLVSVIALLGSVVTWARQGQEQFVVAPNQPGMSAGPFVLTAYGVVWVVLIVYVYSVWRRIGRVERELATVNQRLRDRDRKR